MPVTVVTRWMFLALEVMDVTRHAHRVREYALVATKVALHSLPVMDVTLHVLLVADVTLHVLATEVALHVWSVAAVPNIMFFF